MKKGLLLLVISIFLTGLMYGQSDSTNQVKTDTLYKISTAEQFRIFAEKALNENRKKITDKQLVELQKLKANQLRSAIKETDDFLKKGIDTNAVIEQLVILEQLYLITTKGIESRSSKFYSLRNLTSTELLLNELLRKLESLNEPLIDYQKSFEERRKTLDLLSIDSALYYLPADTSLYIAYQKGYAATMKQFTPVDSLLNYTTGNLMHLQNRVAKLKGDILIDIYKINNYRKNLSMSMFNVEQPRIFSGAEDNESTNIRDALAFSLFMAWHQILFFYGNNPATFFIILLLIAGTYYFFSRIRKRVVSNSQFDQLQIDNEIVAHPLLAALFVVLNIGQFFFYNPPFVALAIIWLMLSFVLVVLHRKNPELFGSKLWLYLMAFSILVIADNVILRYTPIEKWFLLLVSFASVLIAVNFLRKKNQSYTGIAIVKWMLFLFLFLETTSFIAILFGRYNLCKLLFTSGYFAIISGIYLYWTYRFLLKGLHSYSATLPPHNKRNIIYRIKLLHDKNPQIYKWIFILGWVILFLRNFYFYSVITSEVVNILYTERSIGKLSFTLESIFTFAFVIFLSGLLTKLISFLTDNSGQSLFGPVEKKGGISNWLLLIRLGIIITGVLIAFAAAGIPMNRLTLIIGSLGLGIGFGLQNIVNNLISGVILAFERPIEIGDQIEVAGRIGRIKEIGIRSSTMVSLDGAEVIIPNGDLISQHVINWTLSNHHRRVEVIVGVKYGTDLYKPKELLEEILRTNIQIERIPLPSVLLHQFNNSSIDFRLLFWTNINIWNDVKSDVILSVDKAFKEAGIEIPFPQQDVYIKQMPDSNKSETD